MDLTRQADCGQSIAVYDTRTGEYPFDWTFGNYGGYGSGEWLNDHQCVFRGSGWLSESEVFGALGRKYAEAFGELLTIIVATRPHIYGEARIFETTACSQSTPPAVDMPTRRLLPGSVT